MSKGKKIAIASVVSLLFLVGAAYVVAYFVAGNQVPAKASVEGVSIGGLAPDVAAQKLETELGPTLFTPVDLNSGSTSVTLDPAESGFGVDYEATVKQAGGGFSWSPSHILDTFTGGSEVPLVRTVDEEKVRASVENVADEFAAEGVDATIKFNAGMIERTDSKDSQALDVDATATAFREAFERGAGNVEAVLTHEKPAVTTEMVDEVVTSFAEPLLSGPITLTHGEQSMEVAPGAVAAATTFEVQGDAIVPVVDEAGLFEATAESQRALQLGEPKDAAYSFEGGAISVIPAVTGGTLDAAVLHEAVMKAATATGEGRTVAIDTDVVEPEFTTAEAEKLKPTQVIGEYSTQFPHASYRNTNLTQAAKTITGTVLMPGETFSLNDTLGERTAANGYVDGYVINSGRLVKESGGGISQAATTLFNASFFAGYEDVEHKPHSLYFDRYPAGREATVYYGALDMRFKNNTEYPAIIQGYVAPSSSGNRGTITFRIWSQPTYDLRKNDKGGIAQAESTELVKSDYYRGQDRTVTGDPQCEPQAPIQGFTVTWKRIFYKDGAVAKSEDWKWKYSAGDRIICE